MESNNNLKKRLYQNLLNKAPKQNNLLGNDMHTKSAILKPKVIQQMMNTTVKMTSPVFNKGKLKLQNQIKSPQIPKKIAPITIKDGLSKQAKAVIEQGKLKSKANLKPHDIFAFYQAFPQMIQDFFYLNRVGHPYDYQIVTYSQRNPLQYMTISSKGVTLYHQKQAQFMTKDQWLQDQKIYYSLQKIQFFKQYKISKNFTIWKNRMRRHYMKQMSHLLSQSLFFSFQHPRNCLLEIRKITYQLKDSLYFMPSDSIQSMDSQVFLQNALTHIDQIFMNKIKEVQNLIADELQKAINEEIKKFKIQNNIKIADVGDHDQKQHKQGYVYSQQAILRKEYKKVHKLIKLADNILLESKIQLLLKCVQTLLQKIQQVRKQQSKQQWINCSALPVEDDQSSNLQNKIMWHPTIDGLKNIFKTIINETVAKMNQKYQKISTRQKFQKFKFNEQNQSRKDQKRNSLKYMIEDSPFYSTLLKKIQFCLERQFSKTQQQEQELLKFINIYTKHKSLPSIKEIFAQNTAAECAQFVRQWKQEKLIMQGLSEKNKDAKLLVFNYSELKKKITSAPSQTLASFIAHLPEEASSRCRDLLHQSKQLLQLINTYPTDISTFVTFNKAVRLASQRLEDLLGGCKQVSQMINLMQENKIVNIDIYKQRQRQSNSSVTNLKLKVEESNAKYDQSLSKFKKQLQINIGRVKVVVKQLISKFQVIPFDNITSKITPTLQKLHQVLPPIQQLQLEANQIQQIQNQLSLPYSQLEEIHVLYKRSKLINQLWQCKRQWNDLLEQIFNKHYKQINCEQLRGKWQQFSVKSVKLQKSLSDNQVLKKLIVQISEFQNLLETISALTSPNLEQKSWRQISQYLAYELNIQDQKKLPFSNKDDPQYTVQWLINNNISLYKQKITFIVQKSQKEKQLLANLNQFRTYISSIVLQIVVKNHESHEIVLIQKNQLLQQNIKQKISTLYALIGNQYSDALVNQAETLIKHFEYMEEILQGMYEFRRQWEKYEPFFQANAVSTKLLTKESKQFISWEIQWKNIIKKLASDPGEFYKKICQQTTGINCSRTIIKSMNKANMFLDLVKKGIEQFLEKKRLQFPRYCLFTDQQLLVILSKLDYQHLIVPEVIPMLYQNIKSIEYELQGGSIVSITTSQDVKFPLIKQSAIKSQSQMEDILKITEQLIKKTVSQSIKSQFLKYIEEEISRAELIKENNVQIALVVDYIAWVRLAQQTYLIPDPVGTYTDWINIQQQQIRQVSNLIRKCNSDTQYLKYLQFMVQSIYFRQKTMSLAKEYVSSTNSYEWQRIPKMIMPSNQIFMKQLDSKISYNNQLLNHTQCTVIQAETQRVWLNLINAISSKSLIGLKGSWIQSVKDLAFYVGQSFKSIKFSDQINLKSVQRILTGYMYLGCWMHFSPINNLQVLSYIAYHITSAKRSNNFESTATALQLTKSTMLTNSLSNGVFLFQAGQTLVQKNLIDMKNFRTVSLIKPDFKNFTTVLCQAENIPKQVGNKLMSVCEFCKQTFIFGKAIVYEFQRKILKHIKEKYLHKFSQQQLNDLQVLDYIALSAVEENISLYFLQNDQELYNSYRMSVLPSYLVLRSRYNNRFLKTSQEIHPVHKYINDFNIKAILEEQFIDRAKDIYDMQTDNNKFGLILSGQILSGKSYMIDFIEKVYKHSHPSTDLQVYKLYPNAYQMEDIIKYNLQQKRQKKQKTEKSQKLQKQKIQKYNPQVGILQSFLRNQAFQKWIVFDGEVQKQLTDFTSSTFENLLIANYGIISKQKSKKKSLQSLKIIHQLTNTSDIAPSLFANFNVCSLNKAINSPQSLVNEFFTKPQIKKYLKSLNPQSIDDMRKQLANNLSKVQQKGNIKSKALQFLYPFSQNQITLKTLKLIECVFKINQQSIRQKQKNMKKTLQKFVFWAIGMILYLHVDVQNQQKLQKRYLESCKCQSIFNDSLIKYIVYPGSGLQVHPVNGLRTQSCLFQIPQKGIITLTMKNDYNDFNSMMNLKSNKFYQEISLEDISSIRVNYEESNMFSYYSQLFAYCNQPIVLLGPVGSGKKSILELYAKNIRHKSFIHSIRHHRSRNLIDTFEKPYRRYNSLNGVVLKSYSVNKNVVVFIEDLNMVKQQKQTLQFLRMLTNDGKFINKYGQKRMLTEESNSLSILTNRLNSDETVLRLCSKMMFFQTSPLNSQKITTIFSPYLKSWAKANSLYGQAHRIFASTNGDSLLDATAKVVQLMQQMYKTKTSQQNFSLNTILLKPRIGDINKVLSFICRTVDANKYSLAYYAQLWASEIVRVFDDRLSVSNQDLSTQLMQLLKKQFFLKFKQNFLIDKNNLVFTNILSEQNKYYERIEDMQNLQQFIINLIESQTITVPVKLFFNELLKQIMKIYRIIEIDNGHIVVLNLNKKVRQYLIELACQVAESNFIPLKQNSIKIEKDILPTLDLDENVCIFQDLDDITPQQIYQFTCLLNKNYYDYDIKAETKEKIKNRLSKYMKNIFNQYNVVKQSLANNNQKLKIQGLKEKQNIYINQKLQDELEYTMQQIFMNNVHFIFGACPYSQRTKQFVINQTDLVGQFHFSYFDIPQQSLLQISKQILTLQQENVSQSEQQQQNTKTQEKKKKKTQTVDRILNKCVKIYKSLQSSSQNFNQLLCICQNIINQRQKIQIQSRNKVQDLQKCIQNYYKAKNLIQVNQEKIKVTQQELQEIKKQQTVLSQKLQQKSNEINEIQLNIVDNNQSSQADESQKNNLLKAKNQQLQQIEQKLKQIKSKKDKSDMETRQARKIIQLSRDFMAIVDDVTLVEQNLQKQKNIQCHIEDLLILWWCIISFEGKKTTKEIIADLNKWIDIIQLKNYETIKTAQDLLKMFEIVVYPMDINVAAWESISPENRFKGVTFVYTLIHQEFTTSTNRIISLYDPCRIYTILFKYLPSESELGNFTLGNVLKKYDESFWNEIQKTKKGLLFMQQTIESRQKKDIQKIILQRNVIQLNRFVALVDNPQKADFSFKWQRQHFVNYLRLFSMIFNQHRQSSQLMKVRQQFMRNDKRLKQSEQVFRKKCASIQFSLQSDTQDLSRLKTQIFELNKKICLVKQSIRLSKLKVKDQSTIVKIVNKIYEYIQHIQKSQQNSKFTIQTVQKLYKIICQKIARTVIELRSEQAKQQKQNITQKKQQSRLENIRQDTQEGEQQDLQQQDLSEQKVFTSRKPEKSPTIITFQSTPMLNQVQSTISQTVQQNLDIQPNYSSQQLQIINQIVQKILNNNLNTNNIVKGDDIFSLNLLTYELQAKVPVIIVQNNLPNYSFMSKQNRPINLLYNNISNLLLQNSNFIQDKNSYICNKILLFYNDSVHYTVLNELIAKYQEQYLSSKGQKKYYLYLYTNSPLSYINKLQSNNYKIYYYQNVNNIIRPEFNQSGFNKSHSSNNGSYLNYKNCTLNEKSSKALQYIRLVEFLSQKKAYSNMAQIQRYLQKLQSNNNAVQEGQSIMNMLINPHHQNPTNLNQAAKYLIDISDKIQRQNQLVHKVMTGEINYQRINQLIQTIQSTNDIQQQTHEALIQSAKNLNKAQTSQDFIHQQNFSNSLFDQINQELPNAFNAAQFIKSSNRDALGNQIQSHAKVYNRKIKRINSLMQENLQQYDLLLRKLPKINQNYQPESKCYVIPSASYLRRLNKEYKCLKKLLILNGMLIGPSPSMGKIISTKAIGNILSINESNVIFRNCLVLQDLYFDKKILNQLKIRVSKKLKIPFNRVGFMWYVEKKGENCMTNFGNQKIFNSAIPQTTLSLSATLQNCQLKINNISKQQKDSHKLLNSLQHSLNKQLKLLAVPYDINCQPQPSNIGNIIHQIHSLVKKQTVYMNGNQKSQNNKQKFSQLTKIKIVCKSQQNGQIQLGHVQFLSSQIDAYELPIKIPKIVINKIN